MNEHDLVAIFGALALFIMGIYFQIYIRKTSKEQD